MPPALMLSPRYTGQYQTTHLWNCCKDNKERKGFLLCEKSIEEAMPDNKCRWAECDEILDNPCTKDNQLLIMHHMTSHIFASDSQCCLWNGCKFRSLEGSDVLE